MTVTASLVAKLREITGAPILDCKKALDTTNGNIDAAIDEMRKQGKAKADKKSGRTAAEGLVYILSQANQAIIVEVNCETDFVARDENFVNFVKSVAQAAMVSGVNEVEQLANQTLPGSSETVEHARQNLINKLGENIQIRRLNRIVTSGDGTLGHYVHGGRIGVVVELQKSNDATLAKDIAMHIAASNPQVVSPKDVSQELIDKEREIFTVQAQQSGKPEEIIKKMVDGRIQKFLEEVSLLGQPFVKDTNMTIEQLLKSSNAEVVRFIRYVVGEGIEKQITDFAQEVMSQVKR